MGRRQFYPALVLFLKFYGMNRVKIIVCIASCFWLASCIYITPHEKDEGNLSSADSLQARSKDTVVIIDSIPKDSALKKFFAGKGVNTGSVHPKQVVEFAKTLVGIPYLYASADPKKGFDCSGFITYVFHHFDIVVPRSSIDFTHVGREVPPDSAKAGDLILFTGTDSTEKFIGHMGLVVSKENSQVQFIHSTSGKKYGVIITPLNKYYLGRYMKTVRIFPENEY